MWDVIIVGSGPAGLSAAIYTRRAGLSVLVVEKEYRGTGQVAESGRVDNYLGFAGIEGYELGEKFRTHAMEFGVEFLEGEVCGFLRSTDGWEVQITGGKHLEAKSLIYAAGAVHRHLDVPGEEAFAGKGVSYCAICDGAFFKGKEVAVVGGGDTALDDALYLSELCGKVYLVHRRDTFRGAAATLGKIRQKSNIEPVLSAEIKEIAGNQHVEQIVLKDGRILPVSGVFIAVGMAPSTGLLAGIVTLDRTGYVVADETGTTSAEGFFVAGDVRTKALRQVITAVSDGANAATSAVQFLD